MLTSSYAVVDKENKNLTWKKEIPVIILWSFLFVG